VGVKHGYSAESPVLGWTHGSLSLRCKANHISALLSVNDFREGIAMRWSDVLEDKSLRDLPYKIELNQWGKIEMTPASNKHGYFEMEIGTALKNQLPQGKIIAECSIQTEKGVKVADVAWCSPEFSKEHGLETPFTKAPEICVEIVSPSNMRAEMEEKIRLYLSAGAQEVWLVFEDGKIEFHTSQGQVSGSCYAVTIALD
jgi:Uma2 family endonuclease